MSKFKIGQKVRYIEETCTGFSGNWKLEHGQVYTVRRLKSNGDDAIGVYLEETGTEATWWLDSRFEAVEEKAELVDVAEKPKMPLLTIVYNGMTVVFDPSVPAGKVLVDAVIAEIYQLAGAAA